MTDEKLTPEEMEEVMEVMEETVAEEVVEEAPAPAPVKDSHGIKETKEMLHLAFAIGKMLVKAKENNGEIDAGDIPLLVNLFPVVGPALGDMDQIPHEMKDLSTEEVKQLLVFSAAHLGALAGDKEKLADKIEKGLALALAISDFVKALK